MHPQHSFCLDLKSCLQNTGLFALCLLASSCPHPYGDPVLRFTATPQESEEMGSRRSLLYLWTILLWVGNFRANYVEQEVFVLTLVEVPLVCQNSQETSCPKEELWNKIQVDWTFCVLQHSTESLLEITQQQQRLQASSKSLTPNNNTCFFCSKSLTSKQQHRFLLLRLVLLQQCAHRMVFLFEDLEEQSWIFFSHF
jgi:hypothetical protein